MSARLCFYSVNGVGWRSLSLRVSTRAGCSAINEMTEFGFFTGRQQLTTARKLQVEKSVYGPNRTTAAGQTGLLGS